MTQDREGFIAVDGGRVFYRMAGKNAPGVPLLVLHGGPGASHDYLEMLAALADERPVIFYDQLGSGRSDHTANPELWTLERFVAELSRVREALGLKKLFLLGQSWGGMLAVQYALTHGQKGIEGMVLSGPCLSAKRFAADQRLHVEMLPEEARRSIQKGEASGDYVSDGYQDAMMLFYRRHVCRLDPWPAALLRTFNAVNLDLYRHLWGPSEFTVNGTLKDFDAMPRLHEIRVPTLLTCGTYDEATPAATAEYRECIPNAEIAIFAGASHEHHLEQPEEYLRVVRGFLRRAGNTV